MWSVSVAREGCPEGGNSGVWGWTAEWVFAGQYPVGRECGGSPWKQVSHLLAGLWELKIIFYYSL